jgi:predicted nucleic acid-binding protein
MTRAMVDTSVLLRLRDTSGAHHAACVELMRSSGSSQLEVLVCAQVMIEYWVVATRPANVNGLGMSPAEANADLHSFRAMFTILPEVASILDIWQALVAKYSVSGRPSHDARLAALMQAHQIDTLVTLNPADFVRYPFLRCVAPADLVQKP